MKYTLDTNRIIDSAKLKGSVTNDNVNNSQLSPTPLIHPRGILLVFVVYNGQS
mgnify:CR=1 FL=1